MFSILSDLFKITREVGVFDALLFALHLKNFPVEEIYVLFLTGKIPADTVYLRLRPRQVKDFIELHEQIKRVFQGNDDDDIPPFVVVLLAMEFTKNHRRFPFMLPQVDALIEKDIEKNIFRRKGKRNIINREL